MSDQLLEKWRGEASKISEPRTSFGVPADVFLGEAMEVAGFARNYWERRVDASGRLIRPGLESINTKGQQRLSPAIAQELDELQQAAHRAQFLYKTQVNPPNEDLMGDAADVLSELSSILQFHFDDGEDTADDAQLARLDSEHAEPASQDMMALALDDYAALAEPIRSQLDGLADFSAETIDKAKELARRLRERSAPTDRVSEASQALLLRNQIWTLLYHRMRQVRSVAQLVFRRHPEIARLSTSSFERRRRAELRRRKAQEGRGSAEG
jgi:NTP pyrophosphatase (non-canonical NTP hydrolase)